MEKIKEIKEIKEIICPICRKNLLFKKRKHTGGGFYDLKSVESHWECPDCVITHPLEWFDVCHQFEFLVLRKGATKKRFNDWLDNLEATKKLKRKLRQENGRYLN